MRLYHTSNKNCNSNNQSGSSLSNDNTKPVIPVSAFTRKNPVILSKPKSSPKKTSTTKKERVIPSLISPKQLDADAIIKSIEEVERGNNYENGDVRRDENGDGSTNDSFKYEVVTFNKEQAISR